ncbi:hypothetical protein [Pseudomonas spirodelae]|uniref:Uncharacterized protein n=1 Tax=Pseudomonas spirodelae TaxID=3101751 RepID=A0ABU5PE15_9PSED|nr:hypothetical protein [Pseudomonas sp. T5W1]MEA1607895.1 hypothetical protein [Pseudomonas sp. T5W1]
MGKRDMSYMHITGAQGVVSTGGGAVVAGRRADMCLTLPQWQG